MHIPRVDDDCILRHVYCGRVEGPRLMTWRITYELERTGTKYSIGCAFWPSGANPQPLVYGVLESSRGIAFDSDDMLVKALYYVLHSHLALRTRWRIEYQNSPEGLALLKIFSECLNSDKYEGLFVDVCA